MIIYGLQSGKTYVCNLCEGHKCPIRDRCAMHMHTPESYKRQVADYSQAPGFKPPNARESCGHFIELKEVDNGLPNKV